MTSRLSILQKAKHTDVREYPYPFLVVRDALPQTLYDELAATFPTAEHLGIDSSPNNVRWDYPAHSVRSNGNLTPLWKEFIAYHASGDFFRELAGLFEPGIRALYPDRFPTAQSLTDMVAGIHEVDKFDEADILMDVRIAGNTPVTEASSVRSTHLDKGDKLFSGLFYMRPEGYDAIGGDLTISRFAPHLAGRPERFDFIHGAYVNDEFVEHVETVAYDRNVVVMFINSLDSLHGVTVRQPTGQSRLFVNLFGQVDPPLYYPGRKGSKASYLPPTVAQHTAKRRGFKHAFNGILRWFRA